MFSYSDNPMEADASFLAKLDTDPPGTWLAQPKLDGFRKFAFRPAGGEWIWKSKPHGAGFGKPLPEKLRLHFEGLDLPEDIVYDMEFLGQHRDVMRERHEDYLYVFDCYHLFGVALPFMQRILVLGDLLPGNDSLVRRAPVYANPGLVDRFQEQLTVPQSEGLVIRKANSTIKGHPSKCVENPLWIKTKFRHVRTPVGGGM